MEVYVLEEHDYEVVYYWMDLLGNFHEKTDEITCSRETIREYIQSLQSHNNIIVRVIEDGINVYE